MIILWEHHPSTTTSRFVDTLEVTNHHHNSDVGQDLPLLRVYTDRKWRNSGTHWFWGRGTRPLKNSSELLGDMSGAKWRNMDALGMMGLEGNFPVQIFCMGPCFSPAVARSQLSDIVQRPELVAGNCVSEQLILNGRGFAFWAAPAIRMASLRQDACLRKSANVWLPLEVKAIFVSKSEID
ncbi:hypothetical protein CEXT_419831 [Caerostris extrusa]|uniref:Uncharacterized protein n=1 Tax=Caerostris extrusa TaxID=172846 RepID=A0AAV4TCZ9_CAEEX|nr:hypothetical protein CEXT_419831 [Caerostris extrusa]